MLQFRFRVHVLQGCRLAKYGVPLTNYCNLGNPISASLKNTTDESRQYTKGTGSVCSMDSMDSFLVLDLEFCVLLLPVGLFHPSKEGVEWLK